MLLGWMIFVHYGNFLQTKHTPYRLSASPKTQVKFSVVKQINDNLEKQKLHTLYSVGCGGWMMWQLMQSNLLDYSWYKVKQTGHLTRIVSGCNDDIEGIRWMSKTSLPYYPDIHIIDDINKINQCLDLYKLKKQPYPIANIFNITWDLTKTFHIIFVPSFDEIKNMHSNMFGDNVKNYPQLNRILSLYFLYYCNGIGNIKQDYMMVIDPDFIFLKSININQLQNDYGLNIGHPIAGSYGLGNKWFKWLQKNNKIDENDHIVTGKESSQYYEAGVPYILHRNDWYKLIIAWISEISFAYSNYNGIESDMYAYMIANYKLGIKHKLIESFMSTCMKSMDQNHHPFDDTNIFIHYCSSYKLNKIIIDNEIYTFNKHWTKARYDKKRKFQQLWMIECESPLLIEPPIMKEYEGGYMPSAKNNEYRTQYKQYKLLHTIVPMWNTALLEFKYKYCENKSLINDQKTIIQHEATLTNGDVLYHIVDLK